MKMKLLTDRSAFVAGVCLTLGAGCLNAGAAPVVEPPVFRNVANALAPGQWDYYEVAIAPNSSATSNGWRIVLSTTGTNYAGLFLRRGSLPDDVNSDRSSVGQGVATVIFSDQELAQAPGTYYIGVAAPADAGAKINYTLSAEIGFLWTLRWDPGISAPGTIISNSPSDLGGDYFYKITTQNPTNGAWRTFFTATGGKVGLDLGQGPWSSFSPVYSSGWGTAGGVVLHATRFQAGDEWLVRVHAEPGARWSLVSGGVYAPDVGLVPTNALPVARVIGPEGVYYFRTRVSPGTLAWRLGLNGGTQKVMVHKGSAPVAEVNGGVYDLAAAGQMLVVPDYLNNETYQGFFYVGVAGAPGTNLQIDSNQQTVTDFSFSSILAGQTLGTFPYTTYRVVVPVQQIAWEVDLTPLLAAGPTAKVSVRRDRVPNENNNDAFSEAPPGIVESLTLTPPVLSDGTFFVTVYGNPGAKYDLTNGLPYITPVPFLGVQKNAAPFINRVGWRYYAVTNISEQLGKLGWYLQLTGQADDTEIAIRRNAVPGRWNYRADNSGDELSIGGYFDARGFDFLQQPDHPADIWYIGIYNPHLPLGGFTLTMDPLTASPLAYGAGVANNVNLVAPRLDFYSVLIPPGTPSWRLALLNTPPGDVFLMARKDSLPLLPEASGNSIASAAGKLISKTGDEHLLLLPFNGETQLAPGTYYLAVGNQASQPIPGNYQLRSLGPLTVNQLGSVGGGLALAPTTLPAGDFNAYQFTVPTGMQSLELRATATSGFPIMALRYSTNLATSIDMNYGLEGGWGNDYSDASVISLPNPKPGVYSLLVQARPVGDPPPAATYALSFSAAAPGVLAFDAGRAVVAGQGTGTWRYFQVHVPTNALGWDLRLVDVTGGQPQLFVRRGQLPDRTLGSDLSGETQWPVGAQWNLGADWLSDAYGRVLVAGMGNPLEPNRAANEYYYIGVYNSGDDPASYALQSQGIGTAFSIGVQPLSFAKDVANILPLPRGQAAYFSIHIANTPGTSLPLSWQASLAAKSGESMLLVQKDYLPNLGASPFVSVWSTRGGLKLQRTGDEHLTLLPDYHSGLTNLSPGTYYLAVVSEGGAAGGTCTAALSTLGTLPIQPLGMLWGSDIVAKDMVFGGDVKAYTFQLTNVIAGIEGGAPTLVQGIEVWLENRTGDPVMHLRQGEHLPGAALLSTALGYYGGDGGEFDGRTAPQLITWPNPVSGVYSLVVKGGPGDGTYPDAAYTLRIRLVKVTQLSFDPSISSTVKTNLITVTNHLPGAWRFFQVDVPTLALGWDLRTRNVIGAVFSRPALIVRRGFLPDLADLQAMQVNGNSDSWPLGGQWTAGFDWTGYGSDSQGNPEWGSTLAAGVGRPLEADTYFVGIVNYGDDPVTYVLESRGIGSSFVLPVTDLSIVGSVTNAGLVARQAAYYHVKVPNVIPNEPTRAWAVQLANTVGETLLAVRKDGLPNVNATSAHSVFSPSGKLMQKAGNEYFYLVPEANQDYIPGGDYYLAVVSEGVNPGLATIGNGSSGYVLQSLGQPKINNLGALGAADLRMTASLAGGQFSIYTFTVPVGVASFEVILTNRVGAPMLALAPGSDVPNPTMDWFSSYGVNGGVSGIGNPARLTVSAPQPGQYTLAIKAERDSTGFPDASFTLIVHQTVIPISPLSFTPALNTPTLNNVASGVLIDQQSVFFQVQIPTSVNLLPVIGWRIHLDQVIGRARVRVSQGALPPSSLVFNYDTLVVVPPALTPGVWFIEVRGEGNTQFTLTSELLTLAQAPWTLPATVSSVSRPVPFADTGNVDLPLLDWHFYAVDVPINRSLCRVQLEAISGIPVLYARVGAPPSLTDAIATGNTVSGRMWDLALNRLTGSQYANWVPVSRTSETNLPPGRWYLGVYASQNSNVRYRLKLSTGWIQDWPISAGPITNLLAAADWLYYRVSMPDRAPLQWTVSFTQLSGAVSLHFRDTIPPGEGGGSSDVSDWNSDYSFREPGAVYPYFDVPGVHTLTSPPLRPGQVYYVGVKATTDATFTFASTASPATIPVLATIPFYGGSATNWLAPGAQALYRIDVPSDGARWISQAIHAAGVTLHLRQGTVPQPPVADWQSNDSNSRLDLVFADYGWPWVPGQAYFLLVTNTTAVAQPFAFQMDGRAAASLVPTITSAKLSGVTLSISVATQVGQNYSLEFKYDLSDSLWTFLQTLPGTGGNIVFTDTIVAAPRRYYRVRVP
jgi:large repetitive protein